MQPADQTWWIGSVRLANRVVAAPMAGVTDKAFRLLARELGCGLVYTEMVSAKALLYGSQRTRELYDLSGEDPPVAVQLFGSNPSELARAAVLVEEAGASIVDLNLGCPTPKVVKNGDCAALLREPERALEVAAAMVRAVHVPVTVKMRLGWDSAYPVAVELARSLAQAGVAAVAVHGRYRDQFYHGKADWEAIARVRQAVNIPVLGNGDVRSPQDARLMLEQTGCQAVMVGRGALGNPWLFGRLACFLAGGGDPGPPQAWQRVEMAVRHLNLVVRFKGEEQAVRQMRKHIAWYLKGLPQATRLREQVHQLGRLEEVHELLEAYARDLSGFIT